MNAQMFLCVTASSWQKDLLLEMCCFSVWVQTGDQAHREEPAVFSVRLQRGSRTKKQDFDRCPGQLGVPGLDGSMSESKRN